MQAKPHRMSTQQPQSIRNTQQSESTQARSPDKDRGGRGGRGGSGKRRPGCNKTRVKQKNVRSRHNKQFSCTLKASALSSTHGVCCSNRQACLFCCVRLNPHYLWWQETLPPTTPPPPPLLTGMLIFPKALVALVKSPVDQPSNATQLTGSIPVHPTMQVGPLRKRQAINGKPQERKEMLSSCILWRQHHSATTQSHRKARDSCELLQTVREENRRKSSASFPAASAGEERIQQHSNLKKQSVLFSNGTELLLDWTLGCLYHDGSGIRDG